MVGLDEVLQDLDNRVRPCSVVLIVANFDRAFIVHLSHTTMCQFVGGCGYDAARGLVAVSHCATVSVWTGLDAT